MRELFIFQVTYIFTKHVVRLPNNYSIEPDRCYGVHAVKDQQHPLIGSVDEHASESGTGHRESFKQ